MQSWKFSWPAWDMLNNFCFEVFAQKWVFVIMSHVTCCMSHVACHMSYVKCLCWSLGHAEQFLFSCLCSNVAVYGWKRQWFFFDTSTLSCEWTNHRAGSQLKMSESQTKAGNQKKFENLKIWKFENLKIWKFKNLKIEIQKSKWLKLILGTCWTTFVFMSRLKSRCFEVFLGHPHPILWVCQS